MLKLTITLDKSEISFLKNRFRMSLSPDLVHNFEMFESYASNHVVLPVYKCTKVF